MPEFRLSRRRALIDMDPLFTQLGRFGAEGLKEHQVHFAMGGDSDSLTVRFQTEALIGVRQRLPSSPKSGRLLGHSSHRELGSIDAPFTTIANWTAYGGITYESRILSPEG